MTTLATSFCSDDFTFTQVARTGQLALFSKTKPNHLRPCFEVVRIQTHKAERIFGKDYPERESMPPSESWGTCGWSYSDLPSAQAKFDKLVMEQGCPNSPSVKTPDAS